MKTSSNEKSIKPLLTVKDVAHILRCGRDKAYRTMNRVDFPTIRLDGTLLAIEEDVNKWIIRQRNAKRY